MNENEVRPCPVEGLHLVEDGKGGICPDECVFWGRGSLINDEHEDCELYTDENGNTCNNTSKELHWEKRV